MDKGKDKVRDSGGSAALMVFSAGQGEGSHPHETGRKSLSHALGRRCNMRVKRKTGRYKANRVPGNNLVDVGK